MNVLRRVVRNIIFSLGGQLVTWTSTLLLTIAYGRFLGDIKLGELYLALTFVALIGVPMESGFNQQLTRDVAEQPNLAWRYLSNTLLLKMMLWLGLYGLIILICQLLNYSIEQQHLIWICGLALLGTGITNTFAALHFAFERAIYPAIGTILEKGLAALFGILLLRQGAGVTVMAFVLLGCAFINTTWQAISFCRLEGVRFSIDRETMRNLLRASIPFLAYGIIGVIYYRIDTVLLSLMTSTAAVGWYGAAYRLFDTLTFLPSLVITAIMYPVFSKINQTSEEALKVAIEKSANFLLFCGIPITTFLIFAAPSIIGYLYHQSDFLPSIPVLQALAPGLIFLYMNTVLGTILVSIHQEKKTTIMAAIALVFNLGLNLVLIPRYQQTGAALVTSLTELLMLGIIIYFLPKRFLPKRSIAVAIKALGASQLMALAIALLHSGNVFLIFAVAVVVYLTTTTLLGTIPREDILSLLSAVRHKKARRGAPAQQAAEREAEVSSETPSVSMPT